MKSCLNKFLLALLFALVVCTSCSRQQKAESLYNSGLKKIPSDFTGAIADFNQAIELNPQYIDAYKWRRFAKFSLADFSGAKADCVAIVELTTKAIELNPQNANAYNSRGNAKFNLEDYSGAVADFNKAIEMNPTNAGTYNDRGAAKFKLKDYDGAISDCKIAIKMDPKFSSERIISAAEDALRQKKP